MATDYDEPPKGPRPRSIYEVEPAEPPKEQPTPPPLQLVTGKGGKKPRGDAPTPPPPLSGEPQGDIFLTDKFLTAHSRDVRYCPSRGWLIWDGRRWAWDDRESPVRRAEETVRVLHREAAKVVDEEARERAIKHARLFDSNSRIHGALNLARTHVALTQDELDADGFLLNCRNGTVDLRDGSLRPHRRDDHITKLVDLDYLGAASPAPRFEQFLREIFDQDTELIDYLQRAIGHSFTADQREQCLHFQWGTGANGKTTLVEILLAASGDYGHSAPADLLMERRFGENIPTDRADLAGKRFVAVAETGENRALAEAQVKTMTGGDRLTGRHLYHDTFTFTPTHHIWLSSNHKPNISGTDLGIWRRIRLVPFTQRFEGAAVDPTLKTALEAELPGVLSWVVAGAVLWFREGRLQPPAVITEATAEYRTEQDVLAELLADCFEQGQWSKESRDFEESSAKVYATYCTWAGGKTPPWTKTRLGRRLTERGFKTDPNRRGKTWLGLRVRKDLGQ